MKGGWEAWTTPEGMVAIQMADGEIITVKNDGVTGYGFALDYLKKMSVNYRNHLRAADLILQRQLGDTYKHIRKIPNLYNSNLAVISMNCVFGNMDHVPDRDASGEFHFEFSRCPFRATCPFNGYNTANKNKDLVCCNPIYETDLTPKQREVADLLVNTSYSMSDIASVMGISETRVKHHASDVYSTIGVNTRQELMLLLKDKRIY